LRFVTDEFLRVADVPETPGVVRNAKKNRKPNILRAYALGQQLREIARTAPFALHVARLTEYRAVIWLKITKADHDHVHPVFVRVMAAQAFAEHLRSRVNRPSPRRA